MSAWALRQFARREFLLERDVYASLLELVCAEAGATTGYLYRYDPAEEELTLAAVSAAVEPELDELAPRRFPLAAAGAWANCLRDGKPSLYRGYPPASASPLPGLDISLQNHASLPLSVDGSLAGAVGIAALSSGIEDALVERLAAFLERAWPLLEERVAACRERVAAQLSEAPVDRVLEDMIRAIASALEVREEHSARHQQNVAHLCDCVAREIGMSEFERRGLAIGASLHDIGKLNVPAALLAKPDSVSDTEFGVLQSHAELGAALFQNLRLPWPVVEMIAQHHERLDGSGYPSHLQRNDICEGARIIAIADTYDAMSSDRPYRRARGTSKALETLRAGRGSLFDAYLVDAFLRCASADPGFGGRYHSA